MGTMESTATGELGLLRFYNARVPVGFLVETFTKRSHRKCYGRGFEERADGTRYICDCVKVRAVRRYNQIGAGAFEAEGLKWRAGKVAASAAATAPAAPTPAPAAEVPAVAAPADDEKSG